MNPHANSEFYYTTPYINIEKVHIPSDDKPCVVYDLSGQGRYRDNWSFFYPDVDGIMFVIDASDQDRLNIVKDVLDEMTKHPSIKDRAGLPFILMLNKMDKGNACE